MSHPFSSHFRRTMALALGTAFLAGGAAAAGNDHDRARKAVEAGEVLPLRTILDRVERTHPGQVIDVELEREHEDGRERWIYEIKLLRSDGALIKLKVDARDGNLLGSKRKERDSGGIAPQKTRSSGEGR